MNLKLLGRLVLILCLPQTMFAQGIVFTQLSTPFNNPIGVDYHEPTNSVILSANYSGGLPSNLERVQFDGSHVQYSGLAGLTDELKIATVRSAFNPGGFVVGDVFSGNGQDGQIVRVTDGGATVVNPWVSLPGAGNGLMRGSLYIDRTGVYGGDLIVCTTGGEVWRINAAGTPSFIADVNTHLEGLCTIPNDPVKYGPLAGRILAGAEAQGRLYSFDAAGGFTFYTLGIDVEDIDIIMPNEAFIGVNFGTGKLLAAPATAFAGMEGDILLTQEFPSGGSGLHRLFWNGTALQTTQFTAAAGSAPVGQWEHVTFAPAGIAPFPNCVVSPSNTLSATVGSPISFTVTGLDVVLLDQVTISSSALPSGATMSPTLPATGNPVVATFNWVPTDVGVYSVLFTVTDTALLQSVCNVTITVTCPTPAAYSNYGVGSAGTLGVPSITLTGPPVLGSSVDLLVSNSWGASNVTCILVGSAPAALTYPSVPATILVDPAAPSTQMFDFLLPPSGLVAPFDLPSIGSLCGVTLYLQAIQYDPGSGAFPYAFTQGLAMTLGS